MALKGLDIFKLSPKKNCKECGCPTCMSFCMKAAQGAASLEQCPYFSEEALAVLKQASEPPMKTVHVGDLTLGGETVLFRHEKTFVSPTRFAACVCSKEDAERLLRIDYERIEEREYIEFAYLTEGSDWEPLLPMLLGAGRIPILDFADTALAEKALSLCNGQAVLAGTNAENLAERNELAKQYGAVLCIGGKDLSALSDAVKKAEALGNKNLILDITGMTVKESFANAVLTRRGALADGERSLGYPSLINLARLAKGNTHLQTALAALFTAKYGSVLVLQCPDYAEMLPLFALRQNLFTDPAMPMKVTPGIYPLNGATPDDPCMITVDFALTYYLVSGEIERSGVPINLLIADASGMSVLTAWAAGKFSAGTIKAFFDEQSISEKLRTRTLILPGKVAAIRSELAQKLPGWNIINGTKEAVEIVRYLKNGEHLKAAREAKAEQTEAAAQPERLTVPEIPHRDYGVSYKRRDPDSEKFVVIGERIHCISPVIREAMAHFDPDPILERAAQQIKAGATYLDVNIGPAESNGPELMTWAVKLLQENFDNVPLALDTTNQKAIEAGIRAYDRTNGKPIINSANAGSRISNIDLAAANDAIVISLCSADGLPRDNEERMHFCHMMLERGLSRGMEPSDLWFDPLFLVVKGMQEKQTEVLDAIKRFSDEGLKSTGGLSNASNGAPKEVRPIMDASLIAMAMMQGLTSAIVNPNNRRLMETVRACDIYLNHELYSDSFLEV